MNGDHEEACPACLGDGGHLEDWDEGDPEWVDCRECGGMGSVLAPVVEVPC